MSAKETYRAVPKQVREEEFQKSGKTNDLPQDKKASEKRENLKREGKNASMHKSHKRG